MFCTRRTASVTAGVACVVATACYLLSAARSPGAHKDSQQALLRSRARMHSSGPGAGVQFGSAPAPLPLTMAWEGGLEGSAARVHCTTSPPYTCAVFANAFWDVGGLNYTTPPGPHLVSGADVALLGETPVGLAWGTDHGGTTDSGDGLPAGASDATFVAGEPALYAGTRASGSQLFDWRFHQRMEAPGAWEVPRAMCVRPWAKDLRTGAFASLPPRCVLLPLDDDDGTREPGPILSRQDTGHYSAACVCASAARTCRLTVRVGIEVTSGGGPLDGIVGGSEHSVDGGDWEQGWSLRPFGSLEEAELPAGGTSFRPVPPRTIWLQGHSLIFDRHLPYPLDTPPARVCSRAWVQNEVTAASAWVDLACLATRGAGGELSSDCAGLPSGLSHPSRPVEYCTSVVYSLV